jgi:hypothetical protein
MPDSPTEKPEGPELIRKAGRGFGLATKDTKRKHWSDGVLE